MILSLLTGCASEPQMWHNPAKDARAFHKDKAGCMSMAGAGETQDIITIPAVGRGYAPTIMSVPSGNWGVIFDECMMGNGWVLQEAKK